MTTRLRCTHRPSSRSCGVFGSHTVHDIRPTVRVRDACFQPRYGSDWQPLDLFPPAVAGCFSRAALRGCPIVPLLRQHAASLAWDLSSPASRRAPAVSAPVVSAVATSGVRRCSSVLQMAACWRSPAARACSARVSRGVFAGTRPRAGPFFSGSAGPDQVADVVGSAAALGATWSSLPGRHLREPSRAGRGSLCTSLMSSPIRLIRCLEEMLRVLHPAAGPSELASARPGCPGAAARSSEFVPEHWGINRQVSPQHDRSYAAGYARVSVDPNWCIWLPRFTARAILTGTAMRASKPSRSRLSSRGAPCSIGSLPSSLPGSSSPFGIPRVSSGGAVGRVF